MESFQHTIKKSVRFAGIGLHSGAPVTVAVHPAEVNSGLRFVRADLGQTAPTPAFMDRVVDTRLATTLANDDDALVATTEHLLAAIVGLGIDNALIELSGPEVPIMDGSAAPFVHVLRRIGRERQHACKWMLKFNRPVSFTEQGRSVRIEPYDGFKVTCGIEFDHPLIRKQSVTMEVNPKRFAQEIAAARTFGFLHEVEMLRENGLALGGSLDNAIVVDASGVLNAEGLRFVDEFARHKVLDLIGDLALLGFPVLGHVIADKSGHTQHLGFMRAVAAHPEAWDIVAYEKQGESRVLKELVHSTRLAGDRLLPYLMPPSLALAGQRCPA